MDFSGLDGYDLYNYERFNRDRIRVRDWSFRLIAEASQYEHNCMLTLTYDNDNVPADGSVNLHDYQCFLKNLRKQVSPVRIRFFGCGEYGKKTTRPHYHIIIFNYCPSDLVFHCVDKKGNKIYKSDFIFSVWKKGFISVGVNLDFNSLPYLCKYLTKFVDYGEHTPPFITMSRRPGIGTNALTNGSIDFRTDKMYVAGKYIRIPRFYLDKVKMESETMIIDEYGDECIVVPKELPKLYRDLTEFHTDVDRIRERRREYWSNVRDGREKYFSNVSKFKKFSTERDIHK